jgi:uncharacterized membrane protein YdjX (TVP38/TMEM64 family)
MAESAETAPKTKKIAAVILTGAALLPLAFASPPGGWMAKAREVQFWFSALGSWEPVVFTLATAAFTAIGLPRLLFCSLAGVLFGFAWGLLWSELGTLLGSYGTFLFARWSARDYVLSCYPKLENLSAQIQGKGWWTVVLVRQMPISRLYNDILLGLSPIRHRDFWIGSALGFLPLGVTATLIGTGAMQADLAQLAEYLGIAAISLLLLTIFWNRIVSLARSALGSIGGAKL